MKSSLRCLSLLTVLVLTIAGCKCQAGDAGAGNAADPGAAAIAEAAGKCPQGTVKTAVSPAGEVLYIVAICGTDETCGDDCRPCRTAQCWKDHHHRHWCAKPLAKESCKAADAAENAPADAKAGAECYRKSDGTVKAVEQDPAAVNNGQCREWCVKQIKPCPKASGQACHAGKHVISTDKQTACAPADAGKKSDAKAADPADMADTVEEDDFFVVTAY